MPPRPVRSTGLRNPQPIKNEEGALRAYMRKETVERHSAPDRRRLTSYEGEYWRRGAEDAQWRADRYEEVIQGHDLRNQPPAPEIDYEQEQADITTRGDANAELRRQLSAGRKQIFERQEQQANAAARLAVLNRDYGKLLSTIEQTANEYARAAHNNDPLMGRAFATAALPLSKEDRQVIEEHLAIAEHLPDVEYEGRDPSGAPEGVDSVWYERRLARQRSAQRALELMAGAAVVRSGEVEPERVQEVYQQSLRGLLEAWDRDPEGLRGMYRSGFRRQTESGLPGLSQVSRGEDIVDGKLLAEAQGYQREAHLTAAEQARSRRGAAFQVQEFGAAGQVAVGARTAATRTAMAVARGLGHLGWGAQFAAVEAELEENLNYWQQVGGLADPSFLGEVLRGLGGFAADAPLLGVGGRAAGVLRKFGVQSERGLTMAAVSPFAVREGILEGPVAGLIELLIPAMFGMRGVEAIYRAGAVPAAQRQVLRTILKETTKGFGFEASEEMLVELTHAVNEYFSGADPEALQFKNLINRLAVAGTVGGIAGGTMQGVAGRAFKDLGTAAMEVPGEVAGLAKDIGADVAATAQDVGATVAGWARTFTDGVRQAVSKAPAVKALPPEQQARVAAAAGQVAEKVAAKQQEAAATETGEVDIDAMMDEALAEAYASDTPPPLDEAVFRQAFREATQGKGDAASAFERVFRAFAEQQQTQPQPEAAPVEPPTATTPEVAMAGFRARVPNAPKEVVDAVTALAAKAPTPKDAVPLARRIVAAYSAESGVSPQRAFKNLARHLDAVNDGKPSPLEGPALRVAEEQARALAAGVAAVAKIRAGGMTAAPDVTPPAKPTGAKATPKAPRTVDVKAEVVAPPPKSAGAKAPRLAAPQPAALAPSPEVAPPAPTSTPSAPADTARLLDAVAQGFGEVADTSKRVLKFGKDAKTAKPEDFVMSPGAKRIGESEWFRIAQKEGVRPDRLREAMSRLREGKDISTTKAGRWILDNQQMILDEYAAWEAAQEQAIPEPVRPDQRTAQMTEEQAYLAGERDAYADNPFDAKTQPAQHRAFKKGQDAGDLPAFAGIPLTPAMKRLIGQGLTNVARYARDTLTRIFPDIYNPVSVGAKDIASQVYTMNDLGRIRRLWNAIVGERAIYRLYRTMAKGRKGALATPGLQAHKRLQRALRNTKLTPEQYESLSIALQGEGKEILRPPRREDIRRSLKEEYNAMRDAALEVSAKETVKAVAELAKARTVEESRTAMKEATARVDADHKFAKAEYRAGRTTKPPMSDQQLGIAKERARNQAREQVRAKIAKEAKAEARERSKLAAAAIKAAAKAGMEMAYGHRVDAEMQALAEAQLAVQAQQAKALAALPEVLRPIVQEMRQSIDDLSVMFGQMEGVVGTATAETINAMLGSYMRRSYGLFTDPQHRSALNKLMEAAAKNPESATGQLAWNLIRDVQADYSGRAMRERYNAIPENQRAEWLKARVASMRTLSGDGTLTAELLMSDAFALPEAAAHRLVMGMMQFGQELAGDPAGQGARGDASLAQGELGMLLQRDNTLPDSVRRLLGEVTDPMAAFERTIVPMAKAVAVYSAQQSMKAELYAPSDATPAQVAKAVFFDKGAQNAPVEATAQITEPGPLNGLMTYPEVAKQFSRAANTKAANNALLQLMAWFNARVSQVLTQLNVLVFARNQVGAVVMAGQKGYLHSPSLVAGFGRAVKSAASLVIDPDAPGDALLQMARAEGIVMEDWVSSYLKSTRGINTVPLSEIEVMLNEIASDPAKAAGSVRRWALRRKGNVDSLALRYSALYNLGDQSAKLHALQVEVQRGIARGLTPEQAQARAGKKVRAEWPNFADEWGFIKTLRHVPVIGFLAFWNPSMLRTTMNTTAGIARDLRDPKWRGQAATRIGTEMAGRSLSVLSNGVVGMTVYSAIVALVNGLDREEVEGMAKATQTPFDSANARLPVGVRNYTSTDDEGNTEQRRTLVTTNPSTTLPTYTIDNLIFGGAMGLVGALTLNGEMTKEAAAMVAAQVYDTFRGLGPSASSGLLAEYLMGIDQWGNPITNEYDDFVDRAMDMIVHGAKKLTPGEVIAIRNTFFRDDRPQDGVNRYGVRNNRSNYWMRFMAVSLMETDYGELVAHSVVRASRELAHLDRDPRATPEQKDARKEALLDNLNRLTTGLPLWRSFYEQEGEGDRLLNTSLNRLRPDPVARGLMRGLIERGTFEMPGERSTGAKVSAASVKRQREEDTALRALSINATTLRGISTDAGQRLAALTESVPEARRQEAYPVLRIKATAEALTATIPKDRLLPSAIESYLNARNVGPEAGRQSLAMDIYREIQRR